MIRSSSSLPLLLLLLLTKVQADFGDYADTSFDCPALTTCPVICTKNEFDCPTQCEEGLNLCPDGNCKEVCGEDNEYNKCADLYSCTPFACARIVQSFDSCESSFGGFYEISHACSNDDGQTAKLELWTVGNVLGILWVLGVSACIIGWGKWNSGKVVASSKHVLESSSDGSGDGVNVLSSSSVNVSVYSSLSTNSLTLTSYKSHTVGTLLFYLTCFTWSFIQVSLLMLTVAYYQSVDYLPGSPSKYLDLDHEDEILYSFEIIWFVGFVWCLWLAFLPNWRMYFLTVCSTSDAEYVQVFAPSSECFLYADEDREGGGELEKGITTSVPPRKQTYGKFAYVNAIIDTMHTIGMSLRKIIVGQSFYMSSSGSFAYCQVNNGSFYYKLQRYHYNQERSKFTPSLYHLECDDLSKKQKGLSTNEVMALQDIMGPNEIFMLEPSLVRSITEEFSKVFYLYQNFLIWAWFPLYYYYIAILHTIVRVVGGLGVSYLHFTNDRQLYELSRSRGEITALRDERWMSIPQTELVPGDVIQMKTGVACVDLLLLQSDGAVVVDESALTGEATPVSKIAISQFSFNSNDIPSKNRIRAGTEVMRSSSTNIGIVTHTGSSTTKGSMLQTILSDDVRHKFQFDVEVEIVLAILAIYAAVAMTLVLHLLNDDPVYGWFYAMYVVGTALPPLLPTVFVVSVGVSTSRLKQQNIAATSSENILVAGKVRTAFFDKTGTLTAAGLVLHEAQCMNHDTDQNEDGDSLFRMGLAVTHTLTINNSPTTTDRVIGNHVDKCMFESTGASLTSSSTSNNDTNMTVTLNNGTSLSYIQRHDFDHNRMTQSVSVRRESDDKVFVFVKGSPDSILSKSNRSSIPTDVHHVISRNAKLGLYQIALATTASRNSAAEGMDRDEIERNLVFLGLITFINPIKDESQSVIDELRHGSIESYMITGDDVRTGIYVAKRVGIVDDGERIVLGTLNQPEGEDEVNERILWTEYDLDQNDDEDEDNFRSKIISHENITKLIMESDEYNTHRTTFAITGAAWRHLLQYPHLYEGHHYNNLSMISRLASRIRVYGRCNPNDKVSIIQIFNSNEIDQQNKHVTLMCGDGGNDCGALRTAHVGVALSRAEASVVSPFTSLDLELSSVVTIVKEGRCALASAFASYKYMIMYGSIETFTQIICAYYRITFADWNWVFMDGVWLTTMAFGLSLAKPANVLSNKRPTASLLGPQTMISMIGGILLNYTFILIGLFMLLHGADWFACREWTAISLNNVLTIGDNYESEIIFLVSGYQYVAAAMAYNFGYSHRAAWWKNYKFVFFAALWTCVHFYATLVPGRLSCLFRVNCVNEDVVVNASELMKVPLNNPYNTTLLPLEFRWSIFGVMIANAILLISWDYFVVYGPVGKSIVASYYKRKGKVSNDSEKLAKTKNMSNSSKISSELV